MARVRLLDRLCELHSHIDREALLAHVLCGDVSVSGERVRDPRRMVSRQADVVLAARERAEYVSRGGRKLDHALRHWKLPVRGRVIADAGASTGGFTDCLLRHGAARVHAIDVGYNQLDYRLRSDERVIVHERTNIMDITELDPRPVAATADLSFRSLRGAASRLRGLVGPASWIVLLVKPQFEWAAPPPDFDGTVPDEALAGVLRSALEALADEIALSDLVESPIRGRKGNREFLLLSHPERPSRSVDELLSVIRS
ncbi:MAG: TlyA family RNA methyltransferase [Spirochaetota bacterium]